MTRNILIATIFSLATAILLGIIFVGESQRLPEATAAISAEQLERGARDYEQYCATCHGLAGQGEVKFGAPALNNIVQKYTLSQNGQPPAFDQPNGIKEKYGSMRNYIEATLFSGIRGTPMPAWGQSDGGTLLDEHINELTLMILNGDRVITYEGHRATAWQHSEEVVKHHVADGTVQLPRQPEVTQLPFYQALTDEERRGVTVSLQRGCGSCHVIPNIPGASGVVGPSLEGVANRRQIAGGVVPNNTLEDLARWIEDPQVLKPGTPMPDLGLSADESRAVAAYLYTLR